MNTVDLTRRQVLKRFSALGGSSLVIGAMDAWDLMGPESPSRPILSGMQPATRVIILGGGLSGLTVGYELGKLGYNYQVLEARDWIGGLCWCLPKYQQPLG